jgi:hypothetical protein
MVDFSLKTMVGHLTGNKKTSNTVGSRVMQEFALNKRGFFPFKKWPEQQTDEYVLLRFTGGDFVIEIRNNQNVTYEHKIRDGFDSSHRHDKKPDYIRDDISFTDEDGHRCSFGASLPGYS